MQRRWEEADRFFKRRHDSPEGAPAGCRCTSGSHRSLNYPQLLRYALFATWQTTLINYRTRSKESNVSNERASFDNFRAHAFEQNLQHKKKSTTHVYKSLEYSCSVIARPLYFHTFIVFRVKSSFSWEINTCNVTLMSAWLFFFFLSSVPLRL